MERPSEMRREAAKGTVGTETGGITYRGSQGFSPPWEILFAELEVL